MGPGHSVEALDPKTAGLLGVKQGLLHLLMQTVGLSTLAHVGSCWVSIKVYDGL